MYQPFSAPNNYRRCKVESFRRRRPEPLRAEDNTAASANFLADALSTLGPAPSRQEAHSAFPESASVVLNASAEELHRQRVSRSAALGIRSAVEMEKDALEMEHKKRKIDGTDTKSRISSMLGRMRKLQASEEATTPSRDVATPAVNASTVSSSPNQAEPSAPLVFKPSPLAAGGYVMVAGDPAQRQPSARGPAAGKPSSTLLLRWSQSSPLPAILRQPEGPARSTALGQLVEIVRGECGRYGVVRGAKAHILSPTEEEAVVASIAARTEGAVQQKEQLLCEKLRVLVRFDTVTDAFKTADTLRNAQPSWIVSFFPTSKYESGEVGPVDEEPACN